ncbi:MAG: (Fe-S)-binding protein [Deltaproteobacteria bacterium]|jgi:Fe-S oxidoreductase|nr:(Fe-S)-binding protein [Deltaproteobacteria bacterium]
MKLPPPQDLIARSPNLDALPGASENSFCRPAKPQVMRDLGLPHAHAWRPQDADWHLPEGWQDILRRSLRDRLDKYRSLRLFLDNCVRCGACADKCHVFLGTRDPRNMPVLRAELLRAVYRRDFTLAGRLLGALPGNPDGGRTLDPAVVRDWFTYFYQCTACRRCALFCPFGIDTAEITLLVREMLLEIGLGANQILEPVANCARTGNHLGIAPHTFKEIVAMLCDDIETVTGIRVRPPINEKGHTVLFVAPSGDLFAEPGIYTFMGYLMLFHEIGLDYTLSTYASEGGNFGSFASHDLARQQSAKLYAEADRLGARWILGGECGHMWRVINQYMHTFNNPAPSGLTVPVSPVTGTVFHRAAAAKALHIAEFTADLIQRQALRLDPGRNAHLVVTWHDSCNPARSLGLFEEPRAVLHACCDHVAEMPAATIREATLCCGGGAGLHGDETLEWRLRAGFARADALRFVRDHNQVNHLACMCALDRVTLPPLADYWAPGVSVGGLHELLGNALIMRGEQPRDLDLRQNPLGKGIRV